MSGPITAMVDHPPGAADDDRDPSPSADSDRAWDDQDAPPRTTGIPELHLKGFDGPMDVLLDLAERQRIDFGRMSVLALAEQFVAALEQLGDQVATKRKADWVVIATRLVLLRSRLLFPENAAAAADAEQDALAELRRIEWRGWMRMATRWLDERPHLGVDVFARPPAAAPAREGGYVALMEACLVALRGRGGSPVEAPTYRVVMPELWRVSDALALIRSTLAAHPDGGDLAAFLPPILGQAADHGLRARAAVASTLLAGDGTRA